MQIKTNFQQKIEGHKWAVFRLKKLSVHALPGLFTLNIFDYEISLSCWKFRNHHREPLFGHGNTFIGADLWLGGSRSGTAHIITDPDPGGPKTY
jgi:hypothetical protein